MQPKKILLFFALAATFGTLTAQTTPAKGAEPVTAPVAKDTARTSKPTTPPTPASAPKWYEKMTLRGYAQLRYNYLAAHRPSPECESCNSTPLRSNGAEFRRARLIFTANPIDRFTFYLQFDYSADGANGAKHFVQLRDAYADIFLDKRKAFNLRLGQSKVPFGFENMQSSSNRLPLDRAEALNSAAPNERDMGAFFYWAAPRKRQLYRKLLEHHQKGSGDYGMFSFGAYNGQGTNRADLNDRLHLVSRLTWPIELGHDQILEPGIQAYAGKFTLAKDQVSSTAKVRKDYTYDDRRVAGSVVLYPRPFGVTAEYNVGESPTFDPLTDSIATRRLHGGYVMFNYRKVLPNGTILMPFVRYQTYNGGRKTDLDARAIVLHETEIGVELTPYKYVEVTLAYMNSRRSAIDAKNSIDERRHLIRLQVQFNY